MIYHILATEIEQCFLIKNKIGMCVKVLCYFLFLSEKVA